MRKLFFIFAAAVLLITAACSGSFIDPGMSDTGLGIGGGFGDIFGDDGKDGGSGGSGSGGSGGSGGGGGSGSNSSSGFLTFTDGLSTGNLELRVLIIIANNTNTSVSNWQNNTQQVAHYNKAFNNQQEPDKTLRLSVPYKNQMVSKDDWSAYDTVWTGSGTYAIYVKYWDTWLGYSVEKILKNVSFTNGCATVTSSSFTNL